MSLVFTCSYKVDKLCFLYVPIIGMPRIYVFSSNSNESSIFYELVTCDFNWDLKPRISLQDTPVILYSSNTTGASKDDVLTHGKLIEMVKVFVRFEASQYECLSTENVYLEIVPMHHGYRLGIIN